MWNEGNNPPILLAVQTYVATLGTIMSISQKISNQSTSKPRNITLRHIPNGCSIKPQGPLFNHIHISFIYNSQNLITTPRQLNSRMDKENGPFTQRSTTQ